MYGFLVDGGWSDYGEYDDCSVECGRGTKARNRTCDDPVPENGGKDCEGEEVEYKACAKLPCKGKISDQIAFPLMNLCTRLKFLKKTFLFF